jgi:hypothetical protein
LRGLTDDNYFNPFPSPFICEECESKIEKVKGDKKAPKEKIEGVKVKGGVALKNLAEVEYAMHNYEQIKPENFIAVEAVMKTDIFKCLKDEFRKFLSMPSKPPKGVSCDRGEEAEELDKKNSKGTQHEKEEKKLPFNPAKLIEKCEAAQGT